MEIAIAVYLGLWLMIATYLAYRQLKSDYNDILNKENH